MRIDKFLKDSRLIKRRSVAKEMCDAKKVSINGRIAKASADVSVDDIITIEFAKSFLSVKVVNLIISPSKALAANCYEEVEQKEKEISE